jgi:hypothetical protein
MFGRRDAGRCGLGRQRHPQSAAVEADAEASSVLTRQTALTVVPHYRRVPLGIVVVCLRFGALSVLEVMVMMQRRSYTIQKRTVTGIKQRYY